VDNSIYLQQILHCGPYILHTVPSQRIRIWDIVLEHNKINSVGRIEKSHKKGALCLIQKKLKILEKRSNNTECRIVNWDENSIHSSQISLLSSVMVDSNKLIFSYCVTNSLRMSFVHSPLAKSSIIFIIFLFIGGVR
jgi:hypothetical protein